MAIFYEASPTLSVGSESVVATITAQGSFQVYFDFFNLAAGETVEFTIRQKVRAASTSHDLFGPFAVVGSAMGAVVKASDPFSNGYETKVILKQLNGTARVVDVRVDRL